MPDVFTSNAPVRGPIRMGMVLLMWIGAMVPAVRADAPADVALAVVYDTSGSMASLIQTKNGGREPKYLVAKRAFASVIGRLELYTSTGGPNAAGKRLDLSVVVFRGARPDTALPMSAFAAAATRRWLDGLGAPNSGTPLGDAMAQAGLALESSAASSKHLLVLTDGENTTGGDPVDALVAIQKRGLASGQPVFVHVLALDIPPRVFASLRDAGATLVGAADEAQLQAQLDFMLENQILVEAP